MKKIPVSSGRFALVDDRFYEQLNQYSWSVNDKGYAHRRLVGQYVTLHHTVLMLAGVERLPHTDHRNGNRLDNRLRNLRPATVSQNLANRGRTKANRSGFKGVYKKRHKWQAQIRVEGYCFTLGTYCCKEDAARAYDDAALKYFGEFAQLNFLGDSNALHQARST